MENNHTKLLLKAACFAARHHRHQRRKGQSEIPYVNHVLEVSEQIIRIGKYEEINVLLAAILHDTIEDTEATPEDIEQLFGVEVRNLVLEVTDDKSLPKAVRKQKQVEHAPNLSFGAKHIKLSDKISNIREISANPPSEWSKERKLEYIAWGERVVAGLRGTNEHLEKLFDQVVAETRRQVEIS